MKIYKSYDSREPTRMHGKLHLTAPRILVRPREINNPVAGCPHSSLWKSPGCHEGQGGKQRNTGLDRPVCSVLAPECCAAPGQLGI